MLFGYKTITFNTQGALEKALFSGYLLVYLIKYLNTS